MEFTFGIITAGNNDQGLQTIIDSIVAQNIPCYEIIIIGQSHLQGPNLRVIPFDESVKPSWITKKKNIILQEAQYENVVCMHDYITLHENWYEGFLRYGNDFAICTTRMETLHGRRFRDFMFFVHALPPIFQTNALLPYNTIVPPELNALLYISGAYYILKKKVGLQYPLWEELCWGQGEDVEFSQRLTDNQIRLECNPYSSVYLQKEKGQCAWENTMTDETLQMILQIPPATLKTYRDQQRLYLQTWIQNQFQIRLDPPIIQKGIVPRYMGGLGNQLFIVAAAYASHQYHNCPLYLLKNPSSNNKHNLHGQNYNDTLFRFIGIHQTSPLDDTTLQHLHAHGYQHHSMCHKDGFDAWHPDTMGPGTITSSYYQYYPAIQPYEDRFRPLLLKGLNIYSHQPQNAFLHVRRGDYLHHPDVHYIQPITYYESALQQLRTTNPNLQMILLFSDDISWVKSQTLFQDPIFTLVESTHEVECLRQMAQCTGGAICANSTFSWWGAYLASYHNPSMPIFVPQRWISHHVASLIPPSWKQVV